MVVPVGDIHFGQEDRAVSWRGMKDLEEDAVKCLAKLHGAGWGKMGGVIIDAIKGQIHNDPGVAVPLWDDTYGQDPKMWGVANEAVGEDKWQVEEQGQSKVCQARARSAAYSPPVKGSGSVAYLLA